MNLSENFMNYAIYVSLSLLILSLLLVVIRIVRGPTLPDRILALDMLVATGIGFIAIIGIKTKYFLYIDIAIALGLVGFLATIAFARYVRSKGTTTDEMPDPEGDDNIIDLEDQKSVF